MQNASTKLRNWRITSAVLALIILALALAWPRAPKFEWLIWSVIPENGTVLCFETGSGAVFHVPIGTPCRIIIKTDLYTVFETEDGHFGTTYHDTFLKDNARSREFLKALTRP